MNAVYKKKAYFLLSAIISVSFIWSRIAVVKAEEKIYFLEKDEMYVNSSVTFQKRKLPESDLPTETYVPNVENKGGYNVDKLKLHQIKNKAVELSWENNKGDNIAILRAESRGGEYELIAVLDSKKSRYVDKDLKNGKNYYYKVISYEGDMTEEVLEFDASVKEITITYFMQPEITVSKGKENGQKYVQIHLKKYEGKYVEIYMQNAGVYKKLKIDNDKSLSRYKKYRFRYTNGGATLRFKVRTYQKVRGKMQFSKFSKSVKIVI